MIAVGIALPEGIEIALEGETRKRGVLLAGPRRGRDWSGAHREGKTFRQVSIVGGAKSSAQRRSLP